MNPAKIIISDCHLDAPVKKSSGKISFCLLPCLNNDQRLQMKLRTKFKIFAHQEDTFSLGITLPEEHIQFFKDLEKHLNSAAMKLKKDITKIGPSFARFQEGDFILLKTDKSEQEKIYAKIYPSKLPNSDFSCRFWELCDDRKKNSSIFLSAGKSFFPLNIFSAEMSKRLHALLIKFWWKKWCRKNRHLTIMKTGMRMMSKLSFKKEQKISFFYPKKLFSPGKNSPKKIFLAEKSFSAEKARRFSKSK